MTTQLSFPAYWLQAEKTTEKYLSCCSTCIKERTNENIQQMMTIHCASWAGLTQLAALHKIYKKSTGGPGFGLKEDKHY